MVVKTTNYLIYHSFRSYFIRLYSEPSTKINTSWRSQLNLFKGTCNQFSESYILLVHSMQFLVPQFLPRVGNASFSEHEGCEEQVLIFSRPCIARPTGRNGYQIAWFRRWEETLRWYMVLSSAMRCTTINTFKAF